MSRLFLDTNVLVYAFDRDEPAKRERARALLARSDIQFVLSTQVLQEFYVVTTRKLGRPLAEDSAEAACRELARLVVVPSDSGTVLRSIERSRADKISLWDALIVTAALESGCQRLLSEDLQAGRSFGDLEIENPFSE